MNLQTLLEAIGDAGPRSYYLLETFLLQLLAKHQEVQGKAFQTYVKVGTNQNAGPIQADAVAPEGIDSIAGPIVIEIKGQVTGQSRSSIERSALFLDKAAHVGGFKSALLLIGGPLSEPVKRWVQATTTLPSGATLIVWDNQQIDVLIKAHEEFAENLARNIEAFRLDSVIEQSSKVDVAAWKGERTERLRDLRNSYSASNLVLFLGAGVSVDAGVPNWDGLLNAMLANLIRHRDSGVITEQEIQEIVSRYRLVENSSSLVAARYLRHGLKGKFASDVTAILYQSVDRHEQERAAKGMARAPTLSALARLCFPHRNGSGIRAVITYNFDDLLEKHLDTIAVPHRSIFSEGNLATPDELPVYHVHGFLPQDSARFRGLVADGTEGLVFSEEGYHRLFGDPYSWSNLVQLTQLREATCVMIGLSLTDPNLRRLLEVSAKRNERSCHYAIMRRLSMAEFIKGRDGSKVLTVREDAVEHFLTAHHKLQEDVLTELGVKTVWYERFDEIPEIIRSVMEPTG